MKKNNIYSDLDVCSYLANKYNMTYGNLVTKVPKEILEDLITFGRCELRMKEKGKGTI